MNVSRHYPNAPITEAVIDLRVNPRVDLQIEELEAVRNGEEFTYPRSEAIHQMTQIIAIEDVDLPPALHEQLGFKFATEDGRSIWQSRRDGFAFSQLAPYATWQQFRAEARRLWRLFWERSAPLEVVRLAVRYVNRIDIPAERIDLKEYFRTSPEISTDLPQELAGFFMQLQIPQADLGGHLLINQTILPPSREGIVPVVLDIDLNLAEDIPNSDDAIWDFIRETPRPQKRSL